MKKYIALFDWDLTVRSNYAFTKWTELLMKNEIIDKNFVKDNEWLIKSYIEGKINHDEMSREGMKIFCKHLAGTNVMDVSSINEEYKLQDDMHIHSIMREIIFPFLIKNNVEIIVITGSPQEIVELYKEELGISKVYGMNYYIDNGKYTGEFKYNTGLSENKQKIIDEILNDKNIEVLFGFGDSISDIPILKVAKQAFINNSKKFLDGDNVIYTKFKDESSGEVIVNKMSEILSDLKVEGIDNE